MATLSGTAIADTYPLLLKIESGGIDGTMRYIQDGDATNSSVKISTAGATVLGTLTVGVDDTGGDVQFFGATTGHYLLWDESGDDLILAGANSVLSIDSTVASTSTTSGSFHTDGGAGVALDLYVGDDLFLSSDSAVFSMGAGNDFTITHDGTTGATLAGSPISINSTGDLTLDSSADIILDAAGGNFEFKDAGTAQLTIDADSTAGDIDINLMVNGDDLVFNQYDGYEVMRITDTSRVGIGTNSPSYQFQLESSTANNPYMVIRNISTSSQEGGNFMFDNADSNSQLNDNTVLGEIIFRGREDSADSYIVASKIGSRINGSPSGGSMPAELFFETNNESSDSAQRMCILGNGNVGINTLSPDTILDVEDNVANGSVVTFKNTHASIDDNDNILALQFSGDAGASEGNFIIFSDSDTAEMGVIKANSATVVVDSYSDYRLKDNIASLTGGLAKVSALNPITFQYKSDSNNATHEGFLAHEVQAQIPYAVRGDKDAVKEDGSVKAQSFCVYQLIPQMVSAIKELSESNDALKKRIEVLEAA